MSCIVSGMTKTEAAEVLVTFINVKCRQRGIRRVTKDVIEELRTEALAAPDGSRTQAAALAAPHWKTIRAHARKANA